MRLAAAAALAVVALAAAGTSSGAITPSCKGTQLSATFTVVPGSAGAGNIVYRLGIRNISHTTCAVTGLPVVRLFGKTGKALPTRVTPAFRGGLTAVFVRLAPGMSSHATARFSPDVPGPGEPVSGTRCEPVSWWLRVYPRGGGSARAAIKPATPVCEHGSLQFSAYGLR